MRAVLERGMQMREVKVKRLELLAKVRENRTKHVAEFADAVKGYKDAALKAIDGGMAKMRRNIEELKAGETLQLSVIHFDLAVPVNHARDYDQVIAMLDMSVDDVLTIRSDEFACYVMDDWGWKEDFNNTKSLYGVR
jgi:hypothetical protein